MPIILPFFIGVGIVTTIIVAFWREIFKWLRNIVQPYFDRNFPSYAKYVKNAYTLIDTNVATPIRKAAAEAWSQLRDRLILQKVHITKESGTFMKQVETYTSANPYVEDPKFNRTVEKHTLSKAEIMALDDDILADINHDGQHTINFTKQQDEQFEAMGYEI